MRRSIVYERKSHCVIVIINYTMGSGGQAEVQPRVVCWETTVAANQCVSTVVNHRTYPANSIFKITINSKV